MMHANIIKRFEELIKNGKSLTPTDGTDGTVEWKANYLKWKLSCLNILKKTFEANSDYYRSFVEYSGYGNRKPRIAFCVACLESAKEEIEKGFLYKIENLISSDFFDSILEHAEYLLSKGHKDPAAILGRVVIEKTLKHIAERETIAILDNVKLSTVNELLWKNDVYNKITWRLIQGHVDLGNYAAHGEFEKYDKNKVKDMLYWIKMNLINL